MALRLFNGNQYSENGWPYVDQGSCTWVIIPGSDCNLQIQNGEPLTLMRAFAADFNREVETLRDADSACWTEGNSVATSNHPGGTAMDLNWDSHEFQVRGTFTPAQMTKLRALLDWYEGTIFWGGDWDDPVDEMHFQMGYDTFDRATGRAQAWVLDFIARKIGADGLSLYGREPAPVPSTPDPVAILAAATGLSPAKCAEILPALQQGLALAQCDTVNRIAMFIAQTQQESDNYNATAEYGAGPTGDAYKGRTWIMITWLSNYQSFGKWCVAQGLISDPNQFVTNPDSLADVKWAGIGPAWYWTVQRPQINSLCDAGDINGVTYAINGGYNGLDVRTANWNRALAQGDALLQLGDDMFTDADRDLLRQISDYRRPSRSPLRWPHQGDIETCAGFAWNADAFGHVMQTEKLAVEYGDSVAIANLYAVATTDEPGRDADKALATKILEKCDPTALALAGNQIAAWLAAEQKAKAA